MDASIEMETNEPSIEGEEHHPPQQLPMGWRIFFQVSGWILILIGVAGLALPGIQGILTMLLGLALVGLASEVAYRLQERLLSRWPKLWEKMEELRGKIYAKLTK